MKVVIPMSGMSSRFAAAGYDIPKYLIEIDGKKVIEHIVDLTQKIASLFLSLTISTGKKLIF